MYPIAGPSHPSFRHEVVFQPDQVGEVKITVSDNVSTGVEEFVVDGTSHHSLIDSDAPSAYNAMENIDNTATVEEEARCLVEAVYSLRSSLRHCPGGGRHLPDGGRQQPRGDQQQHPGQRQV